MVCCDKNTKMRLILKYIKENRLIILLTIVFFIIRLPFLDQLNLLHDERDISLSGYSIAKTGKDLSGNFLPLNIKNIAPDNPVVSIYYSAAWWLLTSEKTVFATRFPYVFFSSFLVYLVYKLIFIITKQKKLAYMTTIVFCFSPWIFHVTRLAMDVTIALPTLIIAIILQLKNNRKLSYIFYILTFFNYQGFRILIPFLILFFTVFNNQKKELLKTTITNILFIFFHKFIS